MPASRNGVQSGRLDTPERLRRGGAPSHPAGTVPPVLPLRADQPTTRAPVVTVALIAACTIAFFAWQPRQPLEEQAFFLERAAIPCELDQRHPLTEIQFVTGECDGLAAGTGAAELFPEKSVWGSAVVSLFLHGDLWHLLGNMLFLWVFGRNVEDRLGAFWYLGVYLAFGIVAELTHVAFNLESTVPVIGASGAIAGIMGMYLVLWPHARVLTLLVWLVVAVPAWFVLGAWIVLQFATDPNSGIAYAAHIGGFAAGVLVGLVVRTASRPPHGPVSGWTPDPYRF